MPDFSTLDFRRALGIFATGVTIVTTVDAAGSPVGLTANSFNSVSLEPPLILWSLGKTSKSLPAFQEAKAFAVHLLASNQQELSERFAKRGIDKFAGLSVDNGLERIPLISNCAARFQCHTVLQYDAGDHVIFLGEVKQFDATNLAPLVYYGGAYAVATRGPHTSTWRDLHQQRVTGLSEDSVHYLVGLLHLQLSYHIEPALQRLGFQGLPEFQLLLLVGLQEGRTLPGINADIPASEQHFSEPTLQRLLDMGYVAAAHGESLFLTEAGRLAVARGTEVAAEKETEALGLLDDAERVALRHLLKRLIVRTDVQLASAGQVA